MSKNSFCPLVYDKTLGFGLSLCQHDPTTCVLQSVCIIEECRGMKDDASKKYFILNVWN